MPPKVVSDIQILKKYISAVMERAAHHAGPVEEIALAIAGALIWRTDGPFEINEREGEMKNVLWVRIGGKKYALSYNHESMAIEIRDRTTHGGILGSFTNETPISEIKSFFAAL
jgi:hypothetical protein